MHTRNLLLTTLTSSTHFSGEVSAGTVVMMDRAVCCPEPAKELWGLSLNQYPPQSCLFNTLAVSAML